MYDAIHPLIEREIRGGNQTYRSFKKAGRKIYEASSTSDIAEANMKENSDEKEATRKDALEYLKKLLGKLPQEDVICASKLIPADKTRTKTPAWWLQPPLDKLNDATNLHLLCRKNDGKDFHYLCVPVRDIETHLKSGDLEVRAQKGKEFIHIELSARPEDLFQDLRGKGMVDFSKYLLNHPSKRSNVKEACYE